MAATGAYFAITFGSSRDPYVLPMLPTARYAPLPAVCPGIEKARGFLHDFSGFVLFFLGIVVFLAEARLLREFFPPPKNPPLEAV